MADGRGDGIELKVRTTLSGPAGPFDLEIELGIAPGTLLAITGPSGAGKTTLLRIIAGLADPHHARLRVGSALWCDTQAKLKLPTRKRSIGFVFQDYALFPNMTVRGNVDYAVGSRTRAAVVDELLQLVELDGLAQQFPDRLSGGQKQRLALIRALARRPSLLMLDEPLSALDPAMRRKLQDDLRRLHRRFGTTTLIVSHDASEILRLADRVIRLDHGRVVFDGPPAAAYGAPAADERLVLVGEYLGDLDETGRCSVLIDGHHRRLRLDDAAVSGLAVGDRIALRVDEAAASPLVAVTTPARQR
ncbi:MAG: ATP-binding cassette domain-containing protein [Rhodopseudomonas palustris]|uniref:ATP-binding cassette domain-containing protein n=1 Tax=Rhodopseudomonas palustris TaxID=1076 RepID=A0A933S2A3_RHOPL|nr:ATP-binding cassette domain-containing protein [Rhodopseudomonas palustris]